MICYMRTAIQSTPKKGKIADIDTKLCNLLTVCVR
uniref:Uncharacterized protein n=1 Tax=Arundo donax TaxID=35708 RepID=A0A0A9A093_ARUDO